MIDGPAAARHDPLRACTIAALLALLFCALSAATAWPLWESAFRSDGSPVSWLSSAPLLSNAVMAARLGPERGLPTRLAAWLAGAILLLARDEQFKFHARWKFGCSTWFEACRGLPALAEAPIPLVGVVGLASAAWLHHALPTRAARVGLWAALAVGVWALVIDQTPMPAEIAVFEELFEVLAEALFLGVLFSVPPARLPDRASASGPGCPSGRSAA